MMWRAALFATLAGAAALAPLVSKPEATASASAFPGWPARHEGRALTMLAAAPEDAWLARRFPGKIARFSDGERQIVLRWTPGATRLLHPAASCFRGAGYTIDPAPMRRAADGATSACFRASKGGRALVACERVFSIAGESWPDVSAWYWHALLNPAPAGYWAVLEVGTSLTVDGLAAAL